MNALGHLTKDQLAGYAAGSLAETEARAAGRHLLECEACRRSMPVPSKERFWGVLMTENDSVAAGTTSTTAAAAAAEKTVALTTGRGLQAYFAVFNSQAGFAWSAGALVLILTVTAFLWIYAGRQQTPIGGDNDGGEVARINSAGREVINPPVMVPSPVSTAGSSNSGGGGGDHSRRSIGNENSFRAVNKVKPVEHKDTSARETGGDPQPPGKRLTKRGDREVAGTNSNNGKIIVSRSRSLSDCPPGAPEIVLSPYFETVTEKQPVLRWKKVPEAIKYELFISDSGQVLIEKGEVENDTSYRLKTELDKDKSYKWKVIARLPGNKTLSSIPISFSVGSPARKYPAKEIGKMRISPSRCTQEPINSEP